MAEETSRTAVRVRIEGGVQGVGFRYWTIDQAVALGLDGWVRNRGDGSVEAVFAGPEDVVRDMIERCRRGPSFARVTGVTESPQTDEVEPGFRIAPSH
ncbi:MAG: acylphosphatase [Alphaproteobacteria bacterium]